jgi:cell division protein FtsB
LKTIKRKKSKSASAVFVSVLISLIFVTLSAVLAVNSVKSITTAYQRFLLLEQAKEEVSQLRMRNLELIQRREHILQEDYVEKEARDRLYYVKDGEVMVVLPETNDDLEKDNSVRGVEDARNVEVDRRASWWTLLNKGLGNRE